MPAVAVTTADLETLDALDLDELYTDLALAEIGTEPNIGAALENLASVRALMTAEATADANPIRWLINKGKAIFNRYWPAVRTTVCNLYNDADGDWITTAATAIAAFLGIAAAVAVLIIKIAIKLGMEMLCAADASPQPA